MSGGPRAPSMIAYGEALSRLLAGLNPVSAETIAIADGLGRVLSAPVMAARAHPPVSVSAMDGYAVRSADVAQSQSRLTMIGEAPAGAPFEGAVRSGETVWIFTGGWLPRGADRVVIQENAERSGAIVTIKEPQTGDTHIRRAGLEFEEGAVVLSAGERLNGAQLALAATANTATLGVYKKPRVLIVASGDELVEPGGRLAAGSIINSAAYAVEALAIEWGAAARRGEILPDQIDACIRRLAPLIETSDLIVSIGGASVGEYDIIKPAFDGLGFERVFEKVAVKPGKPVWHARRADGALVLGLPGNPASALACSWLFLAPLLEALSGQKARAGDYLKVRAAASIPANGAREAFLRGVAWIEEGGVVARPDEKQDSSLLGPFARANVLIRRAPNAPAANPGDIIDVRIIGPLGATPQK